MISSRMKWYFIGSIALSILISLIGYIYTEQDLPPYPGKIVSQDGKILSGRDRIMDGQQVWQKYGLMDVGSVWGHGTYRGPDFTAQALHMMGKVMREKYSSDTFGKAYSSLPDNERGAADGVVIGQIKANLYNKATDTLTLTALQETALEANRKFYHDFFTQGDPRGPVEAGIIKDPTELGTIADFFFWTAWCAGTVRAGDTHTYTNNWPNDPQAGNFVSGKSLVWSSISLFAFGLTLGIIIFIYHKYGFNKGSLPYNASYATALASTAISKSQKKSAKYFLIVAALFFLQVNLGGLMAHYTVHPGTFYGLDAIAKFIPYNWVKTWHLQLAVFWIAVSWIGMTLFISPAVGGKEPAGQGILVDILFLAVLVVAVGSLFGEVLGIKGLIGKNWFWLGHQGWEYLELGRLWQIILFAGLIIWLGIVVRALKDHFKSGVEKWNLPHFLAYSGIAVVGFFGFGLTYDPHTHLTIADFWRWWVVHTWVEGAFEFFASAAIAFVLINLGLVELQAGLRTVYFTVSLALFSGIIGVGHHYYWFGAPSFWLALGSTISSLEPVPIALLIAEVWHSQKVLVKAGSDFPYKYPLMFIMASVCWEFLGGGVMGLSITTPVINYFEHSTYLTVNHGHTALFGTYGMLSIGLVLFSLRGMVKAEGWSSRLAGIAFWGTNVGLLLMFVLTLLPVGILQVLDNIQNGFWHARSNDFWERGIIQFLGQIRMIPDTFIIIGAGAFLLFVLNALTKLKPVEIGDGDSFK
jgi:nitric oxide reductase subunit B